MIEAIACFALVVSFIFILGFLVGMPVLLVLSTVPTTKINNLITASISTIFNPWHSFLLHLFSIVLA